MNELLGSDFHYKLLRIHQQYSLSVHIKTNKYRSVQELRSSSNLFRYF